MVRCRVSDFAGGPDAGHLSLGWSAMRRTCPMDGSRWSPRGRGWPVNGCSPRCALDPRPGTCSRSPSASPTPGVASPASSSAEFRLDARAWVPCAGSQSSEVTGEEPGRVRHTVHLKSLTLKGFKSFASATTLRFEPGITCVVGPNGSGKSNVVDALSWVMGEQGAKALRGGKMEDVIFAGTPGRAPLGRAEVTLTIDNSDGALPIEYSEVSITRRMFRDGAGEYEINGNSCRLLDIQELLSDSGIGREMHVIVGQGQLDSEEADEASARARRAEVEEQLSVARVEQERLEAALAQDAPRLAAAQDTWYRLSALAERLSGAVRLAQERSRHLADPQERAPGRDPDELDAEADAIAEQEAELVAAVAEARRRLSDVLEERAEHEKMLAAAERAHMAAVRALADRRAGLA